MDNSSPLDIGFVLEMLRGPGFGKVQDEPDGRQRAKDDAVNRVTT